MKQVLHSSLAAIDIRSSGWVWNLQEGNLVAALVPESLGL